MSLRSSLPSEIRWWPASISSSTSVAGSERCGGLRSDNVGPIAALPGMEELNIGHFIVGRAVIVGMETAVREMLAAMSAGLAQL